MLSPSALCDTFTLFQEPAFVPDNPFADDPPFDPDDPFGENPPEEPVEEPATTTVTVLTKVRLSESSGDRAVDARGDASAASAILFLFHGISRAGGALSLPGIKAGDKLASGTHTSVPTDGTRVWTVKGSKVLKAKARLHHVEVSLV
ncbi:MAG: hypothetical protein VB025_07515 [Sphaerochaeta sp.]|nr:hypothetical protein [Sphaerochaeta sp.]